MDNKEPPLNIDPHIDAVVEWAFFRDDVYAAALEILGPITRITRTGSTTTAVASRLYWRRNTNLPSTP